MSVHGASVQRFHLFRHASVERFPRIPIILGQSSGRHAVRAHLRQQSFGLQDGVIPRGMWQMVTGYDGGFAEYFSA